MRRLVYELRIAWETPAGRATPPEATVLRQLISVNGRPPRPGDEPECLDPKPVATEPLAMLLSGRQPEFAFSIGPLFQCIAVVASTVEPWALLRITCGAEINAPASSYPVNEAWDRLQWLAFRADITRVVTFMLGRELNFRSYPEIGVTEGHHGLSHHGDRPDQLAKYAKVNTYQAQLFAKFLEKLRATPDGDGTLLDHSLFLYGAGLSNPNLHAHTDLPLAVFGGGLKGGRHLVAPRDTPMTNVLLTMLDKSGIPAETLGDSTGRLDLAL